MPSSAEAEQAFNCVGVRGVQFLRGPMLCAPIPDTLRSNSLIRADNTVDGMTLKQLSTGILKRCLSGGLATSDVVLIDCTMQHPLRHSFSSRLPHRAAHKFLSALRFPILPHDHKSIG